MNLIITNIDAEAPFIISNTTVMHLFRESRNKKSASLDSDPP